jgi:hypothetical protein
VARKDGKKTVPAKTKEEQPARLPRKVYEKELLRLQAELVKLQEWVRAERPRIVVIFEGRDGTWRARAAPSSGSPSTSTPASPGSPPFRRRLSESRRNGTSAPRRPRAPDPPSQHHSIRLTKLLAG